MYRTPEIVDLYSNFPIGEKQDIWVRQRPVCLGSPTGPGALGEAAAAQPSAPPPFLGSPFPLVVLSPLLRPL